jgi:hypothetical protein
MRNLTVAASDVAHRQARVWAARHDIPLACVVAHIIENLPRLPIAERGFPVRKPEFAAAPPAGKNPKASPQARKAINRVFDCKTVKRT